MIYPWILWVIRLNGGMGSLCGSLPSEDTQSSLHGKYEEKGLGMVGMKRMGV